MSLVSQPAILHAHSKIQNHSIATKMQRAQRYANAVVPRIGVGMDVIEVASLWNKTKTVVNVVLFQNLQPR